MKIFKISFLTFLFVITLFCCSCYCSICNCEYESCNKNWVCEVCDDFWNSCLPGSNSHCGKVTSDWESFRVIENEYVVNSYVRQVEAKFPETYNHLEWEAEITFNNVVVYEGVIYFQIIAHDCILFREWTTDISIAQVSISQGQFAVYRFSGGGDKNLRITVPPSFEGYDFTLNVKVSGTCISFKDAGYTD